MEVVKMVVKVLGYKNGIGVSKSTGEQYSFCNVFVSYPTDRVDAGEECEKLFFRTDKPWSFVIGGSYTLDTDIYFYQGKPQVRPIGLKKVD